jgi:hypothetical protein
MAIGDTPNQNLFGTNYNAEEEERKKALLAAQNARMGATGSTQDPLLRSFEDSLLRGQSQNNLFGQAGIQAGQQFANNIRESRDLPASAFGQAPAVAPFSMEAAGQVNPMMQLQSLEAPVSAPNPVTFLPYADDVSTPRASALSVFAPGGEVKPNVDVNAITPSPTTLPDPNAVNTALNQEVAVGSPSQGPGYFERLREFSKSVLNRNQGLFDVDRLGTAADNLLGSAMRNLTPVEELGYTPEPFGKTFTDTFAITRPDGTKFYPDEVTSPAGTTQAPSVASALGDTQGVTPPTETPSVDAQEQSGAVVSPFLQSPDTPSGLGGPLLRGFDMVNDAARGPNAPMGQDATRAALGGMTLNEYLNAPAGTPGVSGLRTDPQGRMITPSAQPPVDSAVPTTVAQPPVDSVVPPAVAQPPVDALSSFEQDSLERQQRIGGTGSFEGDSAAREARLKANERQPGESQTERDTRVAQSRTTGSQAGGMSFDDARRRAKSQLAERGVKNPSVSMVNDLARGIQAGEPERLAELETKKALDAIKLRDAEAKKDFKPQIVEIGDQKLIQLSPNYYQPVRPEPTAEEPFEPRVLEEGGFTYYEVAPNRFERQPSTKVGGATGEVSSAIADAIAAGGEEVTATPAPTSTSPAPVRINSQAEYDALPVGTLYIDSQGTETVKK